MSMRGVFASDIDNTLTDERHLIPDEVVNYLVNLHNEGWQIVFLTGRTFSFAQLSMEKFNIPFILGVQNGAEVIRMPEKEIIYRTFHDRSILSDLEQVFKGHSIGCIVYSGFEEGDFCYYNPNHFSNDMLDYFKKLQNLSAIAWTPIGKHEDIKAKGFPLVKCFGPWEELKVIEKKLLTKQDVCSCIINDSIDRSKGILMITSKGVDKGAVLKKLREDEGWKCPIVGVGDDDNDLSLLKYADISICVDGGSKTLKDHADVLADSSANLGVIAAMDHVISEYKI